MFKKKTGTECTAVLGALGSVLGRKKYEVPGE